jgi:chemosensory pili system protein ChpA (sensor histidine kinase/response regulator)
VNPDILLLDIEMPRMDGYEVLSQVRHHPQHANLPVIMITSRIGDKHRERAMQMKVTDYLGKPFQEQELLKRMDKLLQQVLY